MGSIFSVETYIRMIRKQYLQLIQNHK